MTFRRRFLGRLWLLLLAASAPDALRAAQRTWDGGGADNLASNGLNWVGDVAPGPGDYVHFDATNGTKACHWNLPAVTISSVTLDVGFTTSVVLTANMTVNGDFTVNSGTFTLGSNALTVGGEGDVFMSAGFFDMAGGTIVFNGSMLQTFSISGGDGKSPDHFTVNSTSEVVLGVDALGQVQTTVSNGRLTLAGPSGPYEIAGNFTKSMSATFDAGTSTVTFVNPAAASVVSVPGGGIAFHVVEIATAAKAVTFSAMNVTVQKFRVTAPSTVTFTAGMFFNVNQELTLDNGGGILTPKIRLRSSSQGSQWDFQLQGGATQSVVGVDVKDSDASSGQQIRANNTSVDSGNNFNWVLPPGNFTGNFASAASVSGSAMGQNEVGHHVLVDTFTVGGPFFYVLFHSTTGPVGDNPDFTGIVRYDSNGVKVSSTALSGTLSGDAFAMDGAGNLYVGERSSAPHTVWLTKYDKFLVFQSSVSVPANLVGNITGAAVFGSFLYTVNDGGPTDQPGKVIKYDANTLVAVATATYSLGEHVNSDAIAIDPSGNVFVAFSTGSGEQHRLEKYDANLAGPLASSTWTVLDSDIRLAAYGASVYAAVISNTLFEVQLRKYDNALNYSNVSSTFSTGTTGIMAPVAVGPDTAVYVAAPRWGGLNADYAVLKYHPNSLVLLSSSVYDGGMEDKPVGLAVYTGTEAYVTGLSFNGMDYDAKTVRRALPPADLTPPAAVTDLLAQSAGGNFIELSWTTPGDDGSSGTLQPGSSYRIEFTSGNPLAHPWNPMNAQVVLSTNGVAPGVPVSTRTFVSQATTYFFHIWTLDEASNISPMDVTPSTAAAYRSVFAVSKVPGLAPDVGRHHAMTMDRFNDLHVVYRDETAGEVKYVKRTGSVWGAPLTVNAADGSAMSIAVDGNGVPHVAYYDVFAGAFQYSSAPAGTFAFPATICSGPVTDQNRTSLALNGAGHPRAALGKQNDGLYYTEWNGAAWSACVELDDAQGDVHVSLALGGDSREHIAYTRAATAPNFAVKYTSRAVNGVWSSSSTVEAATSQSSNVSLALDDNDHGHIVFYRGAAGMRDFRYRRYDGFNWNSTQVTVASATTGSRLAMTLDGGRNPLVVYYQDNDDVAFARYNGGSFTTDVVDVTGSVGTGAMDISLSSGTAAVLTYWDQTNNDLKQAAWSGPFAAPMGGNERGRVNAPFGLFATGVSRSSVTWNWANSPGSNQSWARVYGSTSLAGPYSQKTRLAGLPTTWNESGLKAGTTYYRYVAAENTGGLVTSSVAAVVTSPGLVPGNVRPAAQGGADGTGDSLADIWVHDIDGSSTDTVSGGDGWYTVLGGGTTMYFTSFDTSTFAGAGDVLLSSVTLKWKYSSGAAYTAAGSIQISTDNGGSWTPVPPALVMTAIDNAQSIDLYGYGVQKVSDLHGLDVRFINTETPGVGRAVNFDYLVVEASTPTTRTWGGADGDQASDPSKWIPSGVPGRNDSVVFDDNGDNCSWNITNAVLSSFTIQPTYNRAVTVQFGGNTIALNGNFTQSSGSMAHSTTSFDLKVAGNFVVTGGAFNTDMSTSGTGGTLQFTTGTHTVNAPNASVAHVLLSSGPVTLTGPLTVRGNITRSSGTFDTNGATVTIGGALTTMGSGLNTNGHWVFNGSGAQNADFDGWNNLTLAGSGTKLFFGGVAATGNVSISSGATLDLNGNDMTVGGNFVSSGSYVGQTTITFSGATPAVVFSSFPILGDVYVNKAPGTTLTALGPLRLQDFNSDFYLQGGTFAAGAFTHEIGRNFEQSGASYFNGQGGTVKFVTSNGSSVTLTNGHFNNVHAQKALAGPAPFAFLSNVDVNGDLTIENTACCTLTFEPGAFAHTVGGSFTLGAFGVAMSSSAGSFRFDGAGTQLVRNLGGGALNFNALEVAGSSVVLQSPLALTDELAVQAGELVPGTHTHVLKGDFTMSGAAQFRPSTGTFRFTGDAPAGLTLVMVGTATNRFHHVEVSTVTLSLASGAEVGGRLQVGLDCLDVNAQVAFGGQELTLRGDLQMSRGNAFAGGAGTLRLAGAGPQAIGSIPPPGPCGAVTFGLPGLTIAGASVTVQDGYGINVGGDFTLSQGTFTLSNATSTFGGQFTQGPGTRLVPQFGTVAFEPAVAQNISLQAGTSFYHLVTTGTSNSVAFLSTVAVQGDFTLAGGVGQNVNFNNVTVAVGGNVAKPGASGISSGGSYRWLLNGSVGQSFGLTSADRVTVANTAGSTVSFTAASPSFFGDVVIDPGARADFLGGQAAFHRNFTSSGGVFANLATATFQGGANATIEMTVANSAFQKIRINKTGTPVVSAASALNIDGDFVLDNGTFSPGGFTHTLAGNFSAGGGVMQTTTGTFRFDGGGLSTYTLTAGQVEFHDVHVVSGKTLSAPGMQMNSLLVDPAAVFDPNPAVASLTGDLTVNGTLGGGTIRMNGFGAQQLIQAAAPPLVFNQLAIGQAGRATNVRADADLRVNNLLELTSGTITFNAGQLTLNSADLLSPAGALVMNAGSTLAFQGAAANLWSLGTNTLQHVLIDKTGGSLALTAGALNVDDNFTLNAGSFTLSAATHSFAKSFTQVAGTTLAANGSLVEFVGGGAADLTLDSPLFGFRFAKSAALTLQSDMAVDGDFEMAGSASMIIGDKVVRLRGDFTHTSGGFSMNPGVMHFILDGSQTQTLQSPTSNPPMEVASSSEVVALSGMHWTVNDAAPSFRLTSGVFRAGAFTHTVDGHWEHAGGTFQAETSLVSFAGSANQNVVTPAGASFNHFRVAGSSSVTPLTNLDVNGNFTLNSGAFNAGALDHALAGDFTMTGGVFNAQSSTFTFDKTGAAQFVTAPAGTAFNHVANVTSTSGIRFNTDVVIQGNLTNVVSGGGLSLGPNVTARLRGDLRWLAPSVSGTGIGSNSRIIFDGSSPQVYETDVSGGSRIANTWEFANAHPSGVTVVTTGFNPGDTLAMEYIIVATGTVLNGSNVPFEINNDLGRWENYGTFVSAGSTVTVNVMTGPVEIVAGGTFAHLHFLGGEVRALTDVSVSDVMRVETSGLFNAGSGNQITVNDLTLDGSGVFDVQSSTLTVNGALSLAPFSSALLNVSSGVAVLNGAATAGSGTTVRLPANSPAPVLKVGTLNVDGGRFESSAFANVITTASAGYGLLYVDNGAELDVQGLQFRSVRLHVLGYSNLTVDNAAFTDQEPAQAAFTFDGSPSPETFNNLSFDASVSTNVGRPGNGFTTTMAGATGPKAGPLYENDPNGLVEWDNFDDSPPQSAVTFPANGAFVNSLGTISGSALDAVEPGSVGVTGVGVAVRRVSDDFYWDGASFVGGPPVYNVASGTNPWTYTDGALTGALADGATYFIVSRATDTLYVEGPLSAGVTVYFDGSAPSAFIGEPDAAFESSLTALTGTAVDAHSGVAAVSLSVKHTGSGNYWNAGSQAFDTAAETFFQATGTTLWTSTQTIGLLTPGQQYEVVALAVDNAGNVDPVRSTAAFTWDPNPPTSGVTQPSQGQRRSALTAITGTAADAETAVAGVQVSLENTGTGEFWDNGIPGWVPGPVPVWNSAAAFVSSWTYTSLPAFADGNYRVVSRAFDSASNAQTAFVAGVSSVTFAFDTAGPAAPGTPLVANLGTDGDLSISWTAPPDGDLASYELWRATSNFTLTTDAGVSLSTTVPSTVTAHVDMGLTNGTSYYYRVRAIDQSVPAPNAGTLSGSAFGVPTQGAHHLHMTPSVALETAGVSFDVTVEVHDPTHNPTAIYLPTVTFSATDNPGGLQVTNVPGDFVFTPGDGGVRFFPGGVTFRQAGARQLRVDDQLAAILFASTTISVLAAAPDHFDNVFPSTALSVPAGTVALPGKAAVGARLLDAFDNPLPAGTTVLLGVNVLNGVSGSIVASTVTNSSGEVGVSFPLEYAVSTVAGHAAEVTFSTGVALSTTAVLTTTHGPASQLVFTGSPANTTAGVESGLFTVERQDGFNNPVTTGSLVAALSSDSGSPTAVKFRFPSGNPVSTVTFSVGQSTAQFHYFDEKAGVFSLSASSAPLAPAAVAYTVNPGAAAKFLTILPGQSSAPATASGLSGAPSAQTAGVNIPVTVYAVDAFWNLDPSTSPAAVALQTTDPYVAASTQTLVAGATVYNVVLRTAGTHNFTPFDGAGGLAEVAGSTFTLNPAAASRLQVLAPGESAAAGSPTGKTGSPVTQVRGSTFTVTVNVTDAFYNRVAPGAPADISVVTQDPTDVDASTSVAPPSSQAFAGVNMTSETATGWTITAATTAGVALLPDVSPPIVVIDGAVAPTGVNGVAQSSTSILWSWTDASINEQGFAVLDNADVFIASIAANTTSYLETGLGPNTPHIRKVRAFTLTDSSVSAPSAQVYTHGAMPVNPVISAVGTGGFVYSWTGTGSVLTYIAEVSTASDFSAVVQSSDTLGPATFTFTGLTPNTTYFARAYAVNQDLVGGASLAASTVTHPAAPAATAFAAATDSSAQSAWSANGNPAGTKYEASISTDAAFGVAVTTTTVLTATTAAFPALSPNTTYYSRVRAAGHDGTLSAYDATASTVTDAAAPVAAAFTGVTATGLTSNWAANGNPAGTTYVAEASSDTFVTFAASVTFNTSAAFAGLQSNTTYQVRVRALNSAGTPSADAPLGSTSTLAAPPVAAAFSGLSDVQVTANWTANGNRAGTQYQAQISTDAFTTVMNTITTALNSAVFSGLAANTIYYARVQAVGNAGDQSGFTSLGSTVTLPLAPGAVTFSGVAVDALQANWTANGNPAPPNTTYLAEISTVTGFSPLWTSSVTTALNALFGAGGQGAALSPNTTYYVQVRVQQGGGVFSAPSSASTSTLANVPGAAAYSLVAETSFRANWTPNGNPAGTLYAGDISTSAVYSPSTPFGPTANLFSNFAALAVETTYYVRVRAVNNNGVATADQDLGPVFTADQTPPLAAVLEPNGIEEAVSGLTALSGTATDATTNVTNVDVRITDMGSGQDWNGAAFSAVGVPNFQPSTTFTASTWTYTTLPAWTHAVNYRVVARATDLRGNVSFATAAFTADGQAPDAIAVLTATATGVTGQVQLTWTVPTENTAGGGQPSSYEVRYATFAFQQDAFYDTRPLSTVVGEALPPGSSRSVLVNGLTDGVTHYFHVKSVDNVGNLSAVDSASVFGVTAVPGDLTGPSAVTTLSAANTGNSGEVQLNWTVPAETGQFPVPSQFVVGYSTQVLSTGAQLLALTSTTTVAVATATTSVGDPRTLTLNGLPVGQTMVFYVVSLDSVGNVSALSNAYLLLIAVDGVAPAAITDLSAASGSAEGSVDLSWTVPTENDGTPGAGAPVSYTIRYATAPFGEAVFTGGGLPTVLTSNGAAAEGSAVGATITGLTPSVTYYFRIKSTDDAGMVSQIDTTSPQASAAARGTLPTSIVGSVTQSNLQPINLVLVEALTAAGAVAASARSGATGAWRLDGLTAGEAYTVRVTWTVDEVESSAFRDNIVPGTNGVAFTLEINIQLATLSGTVALARGASAAAGAYGAPVAGVGAAYVEIYQGGRQVAAIHTDGAGRFIVPNLLPGRYAVRAFNGLSFSEMEEVSLAEGQTLALAFKFDLLPPDKVYFYPNPARERVTVRFESMTQPLEAQALVFDIAGNLVKELPGSAASRSGAEISWEWDLRNDAGEAVASGVYLVHVKVHDPATNRREGVVKKLAVIK
jgi:hypothetical protein